MNEYTVYSCNDIQYVSGEDIIVSKHLKSILYYKIFIKCLSCVYKC